MPAHRTEPAAALKVKPRANYPHLRRAGRGWICLWVGHLVLIRCQASGNPVPGTDGDAILTSLVNECGGANSPRGRLGYRGVTTRPNR